jgi:hypothetical protein
MGRTRARAAAAAGPLDAPKGGFNAKGTGRSGLHGVQAPELYDNEEQAADSGSDGDQEVLPIREEAHHS